MRKLGRKEYLAACVVAGTVGLSVTACGGTTTVREIPAAATSATTKTVTAKPAAPAATTPAPAPAPATPVPLYIPVYVTPSPVYVPPSGCGAGLTVNADTSCPFAENVKSAWELSGGASYVTAYSPVTGLDYTMYCASTGTGYEYCTGGSNAETEFPG